MKKTLCVICLICILLLGGCDNQIYHWQFQQDRSEIDSLYVVKAENPYNYEVITEIPFEKRNELLDDIENLEYKRYGWNLHTTCGMCFVVKYQNGEYDIISWWEPMNLIWEESRDASSNKNLVAVISWLKCDEKQFNQLIEKYKS